MTENSPYGLNVETLPHATDRVPNDTCTITVSVDPLPDDYLLSEANAPELTSVAPLMLTIGEPFLSELLIGFLDWGPVRIGPPNDSGVPGDWPALCDTREAVTASLATITSHLTRAKELIYPLLVWPIPRAQFVEVMRVLQGEGTKSFEGLTALLRLGSMEITIAQSTCTLVLACAQVDDTIRLVRRASNAQALPANWHG